MLDSVGSVAVESVADKVNYLLCEHARARNMNTGPRLSPGYGKWRLREQKVIFSLLPGERIGIRLNEQCMMRPVKSLSFCLGIGRALPPREKINPCRYCGMKDCPYHR
jgi:hypothetical protein